MLAPMISGHEGRQHCHDLAQPCVGLAAQLLPIAPAALMCVPSIDFGCKLEEPDVGASGEQGIQQSDMQIGTVAIPGKETPVLMTLPRGRQIFHRHTVMGVENKYEP